MRTIKPTKGNVYIKPEIFGLKSDTLKLVQTRIMDMPNEGTVIAMGGKRVTRKGVVLDPDFVVGDRVLFDRHKAVISVLDGETVIQLKQHDVMMVLNHA
jgi:co-chaperonin GroES (HSP10)